MKKIAVIELLNSFEDDLDVQIFIQRLILIEKIERGLQDVAEGKIKNLKEAKSTYNADFTEKIQVSRSQVKNGETRVVDLNDL